MTRNGRLTLSTAVLAALVAGGATSAAVLAGGSAAAASPPAGTVTVDGTGQVSGTPNVLEVDESVQETAANVSAALSAANADINRVTAALERDGVAATDIQTSNVNIGQNYGNNGVPTGYQVNEGLTVQLHDLSTAGRVISDSVAAGGNATRLQDVAFNLQDDTALLNSARDAAFADAKQKAERYARLSGRALGPVRSIKETVNGPLLVHPGGFAASGALAAAPSPVPVNPGQQQVSVTVTVAWTLQ